MSVRRWLTAVVVAHFLVSIVHGTAHAQADVPLSRAGNLFVIVVILAGPLVGLAITWAFERAGSWLVAITRTCKLGLCRLEEEAAWIERRRQLWTARFDELDKVVEELKSRPGVQVGSAKRSTSWTSFSALWARPRDGREVVAVPVGRLARGWRNGSSVPRLTDDRHR